MYANLEAQVLIKLGREHLEIFLNIWFIVSAFSMRFVEYMNHSIPAYFFVTFLDM